MKRVLLFATIATIGVMVTPISVFAYENLSLGEEITINGYDPTDYGYSSLDGTFSIAIDGFHYINEVSSYQDPGVGVVGVLCTINNIDAYATYLDNNVISSYDISNYLTVRDGDGFDCEFYNLSAPADGKYQIGPDISMGSKARVSMTYYINPEVKDYTLILNDEYIINVSLDENGDGIFTEPEETDVEEDSTESSDETSSEENKSVTTNKNSSTIESTTDSSDSTDIIDDQEQDDLKSQIEELSAENELLKEENTALKDGKATELEEMSVKELKELDAAIHKILGNSEDSSSSINEFGTLSGSLTYFYNNFKGNVADTDSTVLLISNELIEADINTDGLTDFAIGTKHTEPAFGDGVYFAHVGGTGTYNIGHLPAGEYTALLVSGQTNWQGWFDATDDDGTDPKYYENIADKFGDLLNRDDAIRIAEAISFHKYEFKNVTIYGGETTTLDYDFGMTYI